MADGWHIAVIVLGDVGRSPRMQYHAKSLADLTVDGRSPAVSLVGYAGEPCVPEVQDHPRITRHLFSPFVLKLPGVPFILLAPIKVLVLSIRLLIVLLLQMPRADVFLVQNPPSIPTLVLVWFAARISGARFIIDWHNFGFTVLSQSKGPRHPFVRLSQWYENFFACRADAHFSVTDAMRKWMTASWGVEPTVLYDKAPNFFHETTVEERHDLFGRLSSEFAPVGVALRIEDVGGTLFTDAKGSLRKDRPVLLVSSTSWTEDEDFGMLLAALVELDERVRDDANFPKILVIVTGKGPLKEFYQKQMSKLVLGKVHICTMWLAPKDYPLLLGSADLGICLHTSTSGLDLPMKVVDMFGCGLPVCAVGFDCLSELVRHGENGMVFKSTQELTDQLFELLQGATDPAGNARLKSLQQGVKGFERWQPNWDKSARPVVINNVRSTDKYFVWNIVGICVVLVGFIIAMAVKLFG